MVPSSLGVLITYYNEAEELTHCLESLLSQAIPPEEILVYDDASTKPAEKYVPNHPSVRVIRGQKNIGPGKGRNEMLRLAQSDYIHFHDADDLFLDGWTSRIRALIDDRHPEVIFTEISSYDGDVLLDKRVIGLQPVPNTEALVRFCLMHPILTSAGIYRTSLVRRVGGYRVALWQSEDYDFHVRVAAQGGPFEIITDPLVCRTRAAGRSANRHEVWCSALQAVEFLSKELPWTFRQDLAEVAARIGSKLFEINAIRDSRRAFKLADVLGSPKYIDHQPIYRYTAQVFGAEVAEWIGRSFRFILPEKLRRDLRQKLRR